MANTKTQELLEVFEKMTVLELKEFLDAFEEHFEVTAAAPMAVAMAADGGGAAEEAVEEQTEFDVVLTGSGDKKIQVIKEVRSLTSLGLKEAKAVVDELPSTVLEAVSQEEANAAKEKIEAVGGSVEIK
ncbi:MAG: 50S ribosomal protein L7/L12 [Acidimicrobiia bacterium]|nr:50S ribosomal protein L7/L12 [bacterium]MXX63552.1 50S ribosomal protein L7/L12 [Acidimicrobiia bacterium]MCY3580144.1 50S ribosomal protein L7/L12 [bacterium]MCY3651415.1 50S ribosomal protein L7/L12 [bacterium]MDE0643378.1 50S ribosomal protein L7/L12 [bacterium]